MWKVVVVAAHFGDHVWAINNPVTGVVLAGNAPPIPDKSADKQTALIDTLGTSGVDLPSSLGTAATVNATASFDGLTGWVSLTAPDLAGFLADANNKQRGLEEFIAARTCIGSSTASPPTCSAVPQAAVSVVIPSIVATTTITPAPAATTTTTLAGVPAVVVSAGPIPGIVEIPYNITLHPGPAEISAALAAKTPAAVLAALQATIPRPPVTTAVPNPVHPLTAASAPVMDASPPAGLISGHIVLTGVVADLQDHVHVRQAVAALAGVFIGDVPRANLLFVANPGTTPAAVIAPYTVVSAAGPDGDVARRLPAVANTVRANFHIQVPGNRALGWKKDCSMQKITPHAHTFTDGTANPLVAATPLPMNCALEAVPQAAITPIWSWTGGATPGCTVATADGLGASATLGSSNAITSFVTGPDGCGACPPQAPSGTWPGPDAAASHGNWAPIHSQQSGQQPLNLQCWPKNAGFDLMPCGHTVLQTFSASGWQAQCDDLTEFSADNTEATCEANCIADPFCAVWQFGEVTVSGTTISSCWRGVGSRCDSASTSAVVTTTAAGRIQQGLVQVVKDELTSGVIVALKQQFNQWSRVGLTAAGITSSDAADIIVAHKAECRAICYSNILCSYWQTFYDISLAQPADLVTAAASTSDAGHDLGCYVENPDVDATTFLLTGGGFVAYPLKQSDMDTSPSTFTHIQGGEFVIHHCDIPTLPVRATTTTTTTTPPVPVVAAPAPVVTTAAPAGFMNPWGYLLIAAALLAALAGLALMMLSNQPKKPAQKRAVKPIKAKDPPAPPPLPPQPVVPLMAQQILVQPTIPQPLAMTQIAQPMTTYAAPAMARPMQSVTMQSVPMQGVPMQGVQLQRPY